MTCQNSKIKLRFVTVHLNRAEKYFIKGSYYNIKDAKTDLIQSEYSTFSTFSTSTLNELSHSSMIFFLFLWLYGMGPTYILTLHLTAYANYYYCYLCCIVVIVIQKPFVSFGRMLSRPYNISNLLQCTFIRFLHRFRTIFSEISAYNWPW